MSFPARELYYVWVREPDGPLGERRYRQVSRVDDRRVADAVRDGLEAIGRRVEVRCNDARYPRT